MHNIDKGYLSQLARETGFIRDTLEKVIRLTEILHFLNTEPALSNRLALKGGTAINLVFFPLPRLSVDIDLDYLGADTREKMLNSRQTITAVIMRYIPQKGKRRRHKICQGGLGLRYLHLPRKARMCRQANTRGHTQREMYRNIRAC